MPAYTPAPIRFGGASRGPTTQSGGGVRLPVRAVPADFTRGSAAYKSWPAIGPYVSECLKDSPGGIWEVQPGAVINIVSGSDTLNGSLMSVAGTQYGQTSLLAADRAGGPVLYRSASGEYAKVGSSAANDAIVPTSTLTFEAWIKPTTVPGGGGFATIFNTSTTGGFQFSGPNIQFHVLDSTVFRNRLNSVTTFTAGNTYHVVGTYDGTTMRLYINGVLDNSSTVTFTPWTGGAYDITIASWDTTSEFFDGAIQYPAIYKTAISGTRVYEHYIAGIGAKNVDSDLAVTPTVAAAVTDTKPVSAPLSITPTIASAAGLTKPVGSSLTVTSTFTADVAGLDKPVDASLTLALTMAAAADVVPGAGTTHSIDSALSVSVTMAAAAALTKPVGSALTATPTMAAASGLTKAVAAALTASPTVAAAAASTKPVGAALTASPTLASGALVIKPLSGALTSSVTTGSVAARAANGAAALSVSVTVAADASITTGSTKTIQVALTVPIQVSASPNAIFILASSKYETDLGRPWALWWIGQGITFTWLKEGGHWKQVISPTQSRINAAQGYYPGGRGPWRILVAPANEFVLDGFGAFITHPETYIDEYFEGY